MNRGWGQGYGSYPHLQQVRTEVPTALGNSDHYVIHVFGLLLRPSISRQDQRRYRFCQPIVKHPLRQSVGRSTREALQAASHLTDCNVHKCGRS